MSNLQYFKQTGFLLVLLPITVIASRCQEISNKIETGVPLVAKCRDYHLEVQCVTAILNHLNFQDASDYCNCLGDDVYLLNRLNPSFQDYLFSLYPQHQFWVNVRLKVIDLFTGIKGRVYPKQGQVVQNNPHIDHCVGVWPGKEAVTGDLVRQAHPCFHSKKYFVCRKDGAACNDITDENRPGCIIFRDTLRLTWFAARRECIQDGGDLVYLRGNETYRSVLGGRKMAEQVWVGLRKAYWEWIDGTEVVSVDWAHYQRPAADNATCVTISTANGEWHTQKCDSNFNIICSEFKNSGNAATNATVKKKYPSINYYIIGGILGGLVFLLIVVLCCVWMCKCSKKEDKSSNQSYMTMPAEEFFRVPNITATQGNINAGGENLLRNIPKSSQLHISADVQRDRLGNVRPHSASYHDNKRQLGRSMSSATRPPRFVANTMRSVSLEDISQLRSQWGDIPAPPGIEAVVANGDLQSSPLFMRKSSSQRNRSPNNKDRHQRNSKNKINRMNSKNANDNRTPRCAPITPVLPSQRAEIILGVHDGQLVDQNKPKKPKTKRKKKHDPKYVNEVPAPPVPPRGYKRDSQQRPLSEDEGIEDHPSDYNSYDRFRY